MHVFSHTKYGSILLKAVLRPRNIAPQTGESDVLETQEHSPLTWQTKCLIQCDKNNRDGIEKAPQQIKHGLFCDSGSYLYRAWKTVESIFRERKEENGEDKR